LHRAVSPGLRVETKASASEAIKSLRKVADATNLTDSEWVENLRRAFVTLCDVVLEGFVTLEDNQRRIEKQLLIGDAEKNVGIQVDG